MSRNSDVGLSIVLITKIGVEVKGMLLELLRVNSNIPLSSTRKPFQKENQPMYQ